MINEQKVKVILNYEDPKEKRNEVILFYVSDSDNTLLSIEPPCIAFIKVFIFVFLAKTMITITLTVRYYILSIFIVQQCDFLATYLYKCNTFTEEIN